MPIQQNADLKTYTLDHIIERLFGKESLSTKCLIDKMNVESPKGDNQEIEWIKDWFSKQFEMSENQCPFTKEEFEKCLILQGKWAVKHIQGTTSLDMEDYIQMHWNDKI